MMGSELEDKFEIHFSSFSKIELNLLLIVIFNLKQANIQSIQVANSTLDQLMKMICIKHIDAKRGIVLHQNL